MIELFRSSRYRPEGKRYYELHWKILTEKESDGEDRCRGSATYDSETVIGELMDAQRSIKH